MYINTTEYHYSLYTENDLTNSARAFIHAHMHPLACAHGLTYTDTYTHTHRHTHAHTDTNR